MDATTDELVRSLAAVRGEPVVTSLYLEVDGRTRPRPGTYRAAAEGLLREAQRVAGSISDDAAAAVAGDAERIITWLADDLDRTKVRGLAFFVASASGLFRVVELPVPVRDQVTVDVVAELRQLVSVRSRAQRTLVVLTDHQRARLLSTTAEPTADECFVDQWPRHVDDEAAISDLEHAHAEADRKHLRRVAAAIDHELGTNPVQHIVLGGPTEAVGELESLLSPQALALLVGTVRQWPTDTDAEVLAAAAELLGAAHERSQRDLVDGLGGLVAQGRAVIGLAGTFDALAAGRVETLLLPGGFAATGHRCPSCGRLWTAGERCGECGAATEETHDVAPTLVASALAQGAGVEVIDDPALFPDVACLERYSLRVT